ncbi:hypothetical protein GLAREA_00177 [Glarea lozoyensis ATCC 20868]|uniref:DUF6590 domain-containing protein n=1 Tax=Glarea lozoyensis (strain ATCC 20868 / MF5171) TaxID=1116229 RepID=S3CVN9_GLAL2|nr:uncharacterized protein GLAREA_00177 [Glarea lozoyensis ATCC 20868]EPE29019.1 hypothetical protein GLAREA_00177 [Glarea lozoyensis ATCC 20868]
MSSVQHQFQNCGRLPGLSKDFRELGLNPPNGSKQDRYAPSMARTRISNAYTQNRYAPMRGVPSKMEYDKISNVHMTPTRGYGTISQPSEFEEGMIISAKIPEWDFRQCFDPQDKHQSITSQSTVVYEKMRKFVVLRVFPTHVAVLPILTHSGTGLSRKIAKHNYVSIRDVEDREKAAPAESEHPILWTQTLKTHKIASAWQKMSNTAVIHFTNCREHKFGCPAAINGKMTEASFASLKKLFMDGMTHHKFVEKFPENVSQSLQEPPQVNDKLHFPKLAVSKGTGSVISTMSQMSAVVKPRILVDSNTRAPDTTTIRARGVAIPSSAAAFKNRATGAPSTIGEKSRSSRMDQLGPSALRCL